MDSLRRRIPRLFAVTLLALIVLITCGSNLKSAYAQSSLPYVEQASTPKYAQAIENGRTLLQSLMESSKVAGLSVAVAVDGDVVWTEGFGYADLENRIPITPLSEFRVGGNRACATVPGRQSGFGRRLS
jgi:CubicO group peptidase (beta-lactamase class C family)